MKPGIQGFTPAVAELVRSLVSCRRWSHSGGAPRTEAIEDAGVPSASASPVSSMLGATIPTMSLTLWRRVDTVSADGNPRISLHQQ